LEGWSPYGGDEPIHLIASDQKHVFVGCSKPSFTISAHQAFAAHIADGFLGKFRYSPNAHTETVSEITISEQLLATDRMAFSKKRRP
jgi:hypothetical protein